MGRAAFRKDYSRLWSIIILCCTGILIYSNVFFNSFHLDDKILIVNANSRNLGDLAGIWHFWPTRFITYFSFALNYHFHLLHVFGYHLVNLSIHLLAAVLTWWLTLLIFSTGEMKDKPLVRQAYRIALFAGLIFVAHPLQTQGVTYIAQRATSLATVFYLLSLCLYIKVRLLQENGVGRLSRKFYYLASLMAAVAAMFSKEMAITLPLAILFCERAFMPSKPKGYWKLYLPFLVSISIIPLTMALTRTVNFTQMHLESEAGPQVLPWHYLLTQFRVIVTYLRLLILPLHQNIDYDYPISLSATEIPTLLSAILLFFIIVIARKLYTRHRLVSFGIFFFFLTLIPESSIIPIRDLIFEHRLYLPMAGYSLFLASSIYSLVGEKSLRLAVAISLIIVTSYAALTYSRNLFWKSEFTLWNDAAHKSPLKARPFNNRGVAYQDNGMLKEAFSDYNKALRLDPEYSDTYNNRGSAYYDEGKLEEALADYNKALSINPRKASAYSNRAVVYYAKKDFQQALADYNKAISITSGLVETYNNRGVLYKDKQEFDLAIADFTRAIGMNPDYAQAYRNRALTYFLKGDYAKSWEDVRKLQKLGGYIDPELLRKLTAATGGQK